MNEEENNMTTPEEMTTQPEMTNDEPIANGPVLALLAVLLLVVLGGMYYWYTNLESTEPAVVETPTRPTAEENNEPESTTAEAQAGAATIVSTSDEISAIEADLESTDLESLDTELQAIENELNSI